MELKFKKTRILISLLLICIVVESFSQNILVETDSLAQHHSIPQQKVNVGQALFSGVPLKRYPNRDMWYIPAAFELIQFNTVEGTVIDPAVSYTKYLNGKMFYNLKPNLRYGLGNQRPQVQLSAFYFYNTERFASVKLSGGRFVKQLNDASSLSGFGNTSNTLLSGQNFLKIYESTFLKATHTFSPAKDFLLTNTLNWEDRKGLKNLQKFNDDNSNFTSNVPENTELTSTSFNPHQAFIWHAKIRWQPGQRYKRYRGRFVSESNSPAISLLFLSAFSDVLGAEVSYQKLSLSIEDHYYVGSLGKGEFLIEAGDFLSLDSVSFIDFNHFNGNQSIYNSFGINEFQLLDYYQYSTAGFYVQGHLQHRVGEFSIGKRSLTIRPVLSLNYLYTDAVNYLEFGAGIERILKNWRIDFYGSIHNGNFESMGLRFGYEIGG